MNDIEIRFYTTSADFDTYHLTVSKYSITQHSTNPVPLISVLTK